MKGWIGTGLGVAGILATLFINPIESFGHLGNEHQVRVGFIALIMAVAAVVYYLAIHTSELKHSRQSAIWSAAAMLVVALGVNIDLVTDPNVVEKIIAAPETAKPAEVAKVKKHHRAVDVLEPDTPKLERVEKIITRASTDPLATGEDDAPAWKPHKAPDAIDETELADAPAPSQEEREQFQKFLESKGIEYDPKTAFGPNSTDDDIPQNELDSGDDSTDNSQNQGGKPGTDDQGSVRDNGIDGRKG